MPRAIVREVLVDFVANHDQVVFDGDRGDLSQFLPGQHDGLGEEGDDE